MVHRFSLGMHRSAQFSSALLLLIAFPVFAQPNQAANTSMPQASAVTPAPHIVEGLHPAFRHSPVQVKQAMQRGEELAHKSAPSWDIYRKFERHPHWIRKRSGTTGEYVVCLGLEASHITRQVTKRRASTRMLVSLSHGWQTVRIAHL